MVQQRMWRGVLLGVGRMGVGLMLAAVVAGCAANPATGGRHFTLVSAAQEREIGNQTAQQAIEDLGLYRPESTVSGYVMDLCRKTWAVTEMAAEPVQCLFLDSEQFNAWATPGYINVYRGLLPYMQSEAQLVSVIGHEAGHVNAHHIGQSVTAGMVGGLLATAVGIYVGAHSDNQATTQMAYGLAGAGVGLGMATYSRAHEYQADTLGQRYMERLGYDKRESVTMIGAMLAKEAYDKPFLAAFNEGVPPTDSVLDQLYASHPASPVRQNEAAKAAGGWPDGSVKLAAGVTPATTAADPQGRARFHQNIEGLPYGPKAAYGIAGRNVLYLPKQQFALPLPQGFVLQFAGYDEKAKTTLWQAAHVESLVEAKMAVMPFKAGMNVGYVLKEKAGFSGDLQRLALKAPNAPNMAEAYTATGQPLGGKPYRLVAVALPHTDSLLTVVFSFANEAQRTREQDALLAAVQEGRFYSAEAARALKPLRVSTFKAAVGDTVARAARTLPQGALQEGWFRALNGLNPNEEMTPGVWYKTVVDPNA